MARVFTIAVLLVLAVLFAAWDGFVETVSGLSRLEVPRVEELDTPPDYDDGQRPRFLQDRNRVELVVPREMTVRQLLLLYQLDLPHVRRQVLEQLGAGGAETGAATDPGEILVPAGTRLEIVLTPSLPDPVGSP